LLVNLLASCEQVHEQAEKSACFCKKVREKNGEGNFEKPLGDAGP
jgi:hypothetical protein